jgi:hypothetical protein
MEAIREGGFKWRVITMWIMNPASEGADTRGRGDSSGAREMNCARGLATRKPTVGAAEMITNTSDAGDREITGVQDTQSTTCARLT